MAASFSAISSQDRISSSVKQRKRNVLLTSILGMSEKHFHRSYDRNEVVLMERWYESQSRRHYIKESKTDVILIVGQFSKKEWKRKWRSIADTAWNPQLVILGTKVPKRSSQLQRGYHSNEKSCSDGTPIWKAGRHAREREIYTFTIGPKETIQTGVTMMDGETMAFGGFSGFRGKHFHALMCQKWGRALHYGPE